MGIKLPNPRKTDVFFDTEKLGRLYIFNLVLGDMEGLYKEIKSVEKVTPAQYVRLLVKYVCHPEGKLEEGKSRPKQQTLSEEEINLISEREFDDFAEKYITMEGFDRKYLSKPGNSEEAGNSVTLELGEVEHARDEGEKWVDYLHRLAVVQEKEFNDQFKKIAEQFAGVGSFSKSVQDQIKETLSLGDNLKKTFDSFRVPNELVSKPFGLPLDFPEIPRIKPFGGLPEKMDKLIDASEQTATLLTTMNRTQAGIAGELRSSGDKTAWYSGINVFFGGIIILLTTISIGLPVYLAFWSPKSSGSQDGLIGKSIEAVGNELKVLNENTKTNLGNNKAAFEQMMRKDADSRDANQKALSNLIEQQSLIIAEMKKMREQDRDKIDLLEKQLRELSRRIQQQDSKQK